MTYFLDYFDIYGYMITDSIRRYITKNPDDFHVDTDFYVTKVMFLNDTYDMYSGQTRSALSSPSFFSGQIGRYKRGDPVVPCRDPV